MKNKVMVFSVLALLIALPLSLAQAITAQPSNAIEAKPADITAAPVGADTMLEKADTQPTPLLKKTLNTPAEPKKLLKLLGLASKLVF